MRCKVNRWKIEEKKASASNSAVQCIQWCNLSKVNSITIHKSLLLFDSCSSFFLLSNCLSINIVQNKEFYLLSKWEKKTAKSHWKVFSILVFRTEIEEVTVIVVKWWFTGTKVTFLIWSLIFTINDYKWFSKISILWMNREEKRWILVFFLSRRYYSINHFIMCEYVFYLIFSMESKMFMNER